MKLIVKFDPRLNIDPALTDLRYTIATTRRGRHRRETVETNVANRNQPPQSNPRCLRKFPGAATGESDRPSHSVCTCRVGRVDFPFCTEHNRTRRLGGARDQLRRAVALREAEAHTR